MLEIRAQAASAHGQQAADRHRPTDEEHTRCDDRHADVVEVVRDVRRGRPVQHDAERAALVVFEHEHDGLLEVVVAQIGDRDQQLALGGPSTLAVVGTHRPRLPCGRRPVSSRALIVRAAISLAVLR